MKLLYCFLLVAFTQQVAADSNDTTRQIGDLMLALHQRGQFNGSILVAVKDRIIFSSGFGLADVKTATPFVPNTISCLGSVTKQFTAMAVMMLAEEGKLQYDDPVGKYLSELPHCYDAVTIRHLLTQTSGIAEYSNIGVDHAGIKKSEILEALEKERSLRFTPGQKYEYTNSNYVLLAEVAGRIKGIPFGELVDDKIFKPLGMSNSFVHDRPEKKSVQRATGYDQFGKKDDYDSYSSGDGGIFSTVEDLFKWDQALYTDKLVSQKTLSEAFAPYPVREGTSTYGFGWNVAKDANSNKYVWHNGNTGGFRAHIQRRLADKITIIMLTNMGNSRRIEIANAIIDLMAGKPFSLPKVPVSQTMYNIIKQKGINQALAFYDSLHSAHDSVYDLGESELNTLGYEVLYGMRKIDDAISIFKLNTRMYPSSSNVFDSLGEAMMVKGDKQSAITNFKKALELDPSNQNSAMQLKKLE
jgi:CubicO group peptidase (beta-lactamase class C family)